MPVVYLDEAQRGAACAEVLAAAGRVGAELDVPVVLYGELATALSTASARGCEAAAGGACAADRDRRGHARLRPPPSAPHRGRHPRHRSAAADRLQRRSGGDDLELARDIAARIRESGGGLPGVRAIGLRLAARGRAQVSTNVHDHRATPLRAVVEAVRGHAEVAEAELVGLAPAAAFDGFPEDVPIRGFSPERHLLENALRFDRPRWPRPRTSASASTAARRRARSNAPGRTGRGQVKKDSKTIARERRAERMNKEPTWRGRSTGRRSPRWCSPR